MQMINGRHEKNWIARKTDGTEELHHKGFPMKPKTLLMLEGGVLVAAVTLTLALNSMRAATGEAPAAGQFEAPVAATATTPVAPVGEPAELPPAVPVATPLPLELSPGMDEVVQLARSGVDEDVLMAFIETSGRAYHPSVEEIIYLKDLGVTPAALAKLIRTGNKDSELARQVEAGTLADPAPLNAADGTVVKAEPGTTVNVTTQNHYAAAPQPLEGSPTKDVSAEAATQVDLTYFKSSLAPYGSWVYVEGYGEVWRPTVAVVNVGWQPYYDNGRWLYTNAGWYWHSDYSWGWAPFHYGRWSRHGRYGWVWVPGYTWGPAWVEWRTHSSYVGWAPLTPYYGSGFSVSHWGGSWGFSIGWSAFNWVPYRYCHGYYPRHYTVRHEVRREVYHNSTVIRPTIIGDNNTIIINGPDATVVASRGNTEIRRVNLRDASPRTPTGPREYLENGGTTLAVHRPTVSPNRERPEVALANHRSEFRRPATVSPNASPQSSVPVTAAEAANPRNIILRGDRTTTSEAASAAQWRAGTAPRTTTPDTASAAPTRVTGQNTTVNARPAYQRPVSEPTPIGRPVTVTRPTPVSEPVIGGGFRTETARTTSHFSSQPTLNSAPRQTVTAPNRSFQSPAVNPAPSITPPRRSFEATSTADFNARSSTPRVEAPRSEEPRSSRPRINPSVNAPSVSAPPATRQPDISAPQINPPARSSVAPPSSDRTISRPEVSAPSRTISPPARQAAPAPARSSGSSSESRGGGGRGGAPSRGND
jgi:hypothetical protein